MLCALKRAEAFLTGDILFNSRLGCIRENTESKCYSPNVQHVFHGIMLFYKDIM